MSEHETMDEKKRDGTSSESMAGSRRSFVGNVATAVVAGMVLGGERAAAATEPAPVTPPKAPTAEQILEMMRRTMGEVPPAIAKSVPVDPGLILEHARSRAFAMPADKPALDDVTRTLIYLAAALAGSSPACVRAMAHKSVMQGIPREKVVETIHIVRFAMATKIVGDSEPLFDVLRGS